MNEKIIVSGFGGQGVLLVGQMLTYSGMLETKEVSWLPSYGPEMRGGTANVTVILSDDRISSPYLKLYDSAIVLNQQSMDKFEETVKPGGDLLYDPKGISQHPTRTDINIYQIDGNKLAGEMGNKKIFNMIVLGAFLKIKPIVKFDNVIEGLKKSLPERYQHLIPLNEEAIQIGMKKVKVIQSIEKLTSVN